ncbi:MAG: M14 family zinc carboxypeptidase [Fidelibacterota bacterium]
MRSKLIYIFVLLTGFFSCGKPPQVEFPNDHISQTKIVNYSEMTEVLQTAAKQDNITLKSMGKSIEGRDLWLLNIRPREITDDPLKVFLFGQQHGNEPAGKDAIIWLTKYLANNCDLMSPDIDLYLMPMVNPDGAEKNQRRNANNADLNRDHLLLEEPETQFLYDTFHYIKPDVTVDCHEFNRSSGNYLDLGYEEWPQIMMGCGNNPLIADEIYQQGVKTVEDLKIPMKNAGHNYCRYFVGGMPPLDENRYSTLEGDDGRNGMALLGALSFIIESGVKRNTRNPDADLGVRVDAYLTIFQYLISDKQFIANALKVTDRQQELPEYPPVNYFWGKTEQDIDSIMVYQAGKETTIPTANFMQTRIIKKSVKAPEKYVIPAKKSELFQQLLDRHKIEYSSLDEARTFTGEPVQLLRIENHFDEVYNRYGGRQITQMAESKRVTFPEGSLVIDLKKSKFPMKVFYVLDPCNLYGLYQHENFYKLVDDDILPVYRVLK